MNDDTKPRPCEKCKGYKGYSGSDHAHLAWTWRTCDRCGGTGNEPLAAEPGSTPAVSTTDTKARLEEIRERTDRGAFWPFGSDQYNAHQRAGDVPFLLEEIDKLAKDYNQACTNLLVEGEYNKAVVVERDEARAEVERLRADRDALRQWWDENPSLIHHKLEAARAISERRKKALELPIAALECQYPILGCKHDKGAGSCWSAENCERMLVEARAVHDAEEPPAPCCVCTQQALLECPVHPMCPGCGDPVSRPGEMCSLCRAQDEAAVGYAEPTWSSRRWR